MDKSRDAFRTISEVADWLGTPTHVLRFWESRFTQIKPVKRAGGRRYYRPADMALLGGIKKLLHDDGLTIRGVQKILREQGVRHVAALSQTVKDDIPAEAGFARDVPTLPPEAEVVPIRPGQATSDTGKDSGESFGAWPGATDESGGETARGDDPAPGGGPDGDPAAPDPDTLAPSESQDPVSTSGQGTPDRLQPDMPEDMAEPDDANPFDKRAGAWNATGKDTSEDTGDDRAATAAAPHDDPAEQIPAQGAGHPSAWSGDVPDAPFAEVEPEIEHSAQGSAPLPFDRSAGQSGDAPQAPEPAEDPLPTAPSNDEGDAQGRRGWAAPEAGTMPDFLRTDASGSAPPDSGAEDSANTETPRHPVPEQPYDVTHASGHRPAPDAAPDASVPPGTPAGTLPDGPGLSEIVLKRLRATSGVPNPAALRAIHDRLADLRARMSTDG